MLSERGIKLKVRFEEERLFPERNGYLGEELQFRALQRTPDGIGHFYLDCHVPAEQKGIYVFNVDGKKNVVLMRNHSLEPSIALFSIGIKATGENYGILTTEYPQNNLRLLVLKQNGWLEVWEIAIVSQDGLFFLTEQLIYEAQCFLDEFGEVICPRLDKWPQLVKVLQLLVKKEELSPVSEYSPPAVPKFGGPFQQGKVLWWNYAQGLGAIVIDKKGTQARVYWRNLALSETGRLRALFPNQIVSYERLVLPHQTKGRTTGFLFEAVGVKVI